jgi:hypothetical protein
VAVAGLAVAVVSALAGTGFGATTASVNPSAVVDSTISITEPTGLDAGSSSGTSWVPGSPSTIVLGTLRGQQAATAVATWKVTTNDPDGYVAQLQNTGAGHVLTSGSDSFADMPGSPAPLSAGASAFGVAVGSPSTHAQTAVGNLPGTPWGTTGGTQGTLYGGVPVGGVTIGTESGPVTADPITLSLTANLSATQPLPAGAYSGTVRMIATTL